MLLLHVCLEWPHCQCLLSLQHNIVGRLLGPKGMILKGIQNETKTRISILGRGSIKDRKKEEELRNSNDAQHAHLKDDLHVQIEAAPPTANIKLAAGVAEINKMLVPPVSIEIKAVTVCPYLGFLIL